MAEHDRCDVIREICQDQGWHAALTILTCPILRRDGRVWQHVSLERRRIDFRAALDEGTYSHGEVLLLSCAWSLFNGDISVDLQELACVLGEQNLRTVHLAMERRAGRGPKLWAEDITFGDE